MENHHKEQPPELKVMDISVYDLNFSVKALNAFKCLDINTLGDLIEFDINDFIKLRNCGKVTCKEIEQTVIAYGLKFKNKKKLCWQVIN